MGKWLVFGARRGSSEWVILLVWLDHYKLLSELKLNKSLFEKAAASHGARGSGREFPKAPNTWSDPRPRPPPPPVWFLQCHYLIETHWNAGSWHEGGWEQGSEPMTRESSGTKLVQGFGVFCFCFWCFWKNSWFCMARWRRPSPQWAVKGQNEWIMCPPSPIISRFLLPSQTHICDSAMSSKWEMGWCLLAS